MTPATHQDKAHSYAVHNHEVTSLTERDTGRDTRRDTWRRHGEAIFVVAPVFRYLSFSTTSIRNSIENYSNELYKCILEPRSESKGGTLDLISESILKMRLRIRMCLAKVVVPR